jgi:hypothetical protein
MVVIRNWGDSRVVHDDFARRGWLQYGSLELKLFIHVALVSSVDLVNGRESTSISLLVHTGGVLHLCDEGVHPFQLLIWLLSEHQA